MGTVRPCSQNSGWLTHTSTNGAGSTGLPTGFARNALPSVAAGGGQEENSCSLKVSRPVIPSTSGIGGIVILKFYS